MDVQIRKATKEDMSQVLELIQELATFENEPNAVEVTVDELEQAGFGAQPMFSCFVAVVNDEIVGMALVYFRFSTWKGRTVHLEDLIVRKEMRGKGVGKLLYTAVMEYGYENGVKRVEWIVLNWNSDAIKFYERSGAVFHKDWYLVEMNEMGIRNYLDNK